MAKRRPARLTPWRAMLLAPLLAAVIVFLSIKGSEALAVIQSLPLIGPLLKRTVSPNAAMGGRILGLLCPGIPALLGVAMFWYFIKGWRDLKAQRIRGQRLREREMREMPGAATVEQLARNKESIDKRRKTH